ncbi:Rrf2 family transcriptional regulator [Alloscardovia macacae]|uniref:Transcriptional regulator n=1 Tax=Alloscardovia macacae TaxID=1160091 RepID=A0A1Y2SVR2_9BIFI|nr:Rrf2 family transcriptional regulator [Alloscardovia macacae]OTA26322.1 transcriptional regulator [Alloscardovia macacae]OTA28388.1 transcriptional regulator [Alloscardovia macacae]OZG53029.1 transcriptional regulator [Alloscardovia macacae]
MQISSRFTVALHIFECVDHFSATQKVTSDFLAGSIGTNAVIIRKILGQLQKADLLTVARGTGGITVNRPLKDITFFDVYKAVDAVESGDLFRFHENPSPACPVGGNIHTLLDGKLDAIQTAMENQMREYTLADISEELKTILEERA